MRNGDRIGTSDIERLMASAEARTGLSDWGEGDFSEGLSVLLDACGREAGLSPSGQQWFEQDCIQRLSNRLLIEDTLKRHPEILEVPVRRPVFLITFPRSGSTFLHALLCQKSAVRAPLFWEMMQPAPPPEAKTRTTDPRIALAEKEYLQPLHALFQEGSTGQRSVPTASRISECGMLLENAFASFSYTFSYYIPSYLDWICQADLVDAYAYFKKQLQLLQWRCPGAPWVLKNVDHLVGLDALLKIFPDACLVQIHRDPREMVPSLGLLQGSYMNLWRQTPMDPNILGELCLKRYEILARITMRIRDKLDADQLYELYYKDLAANPIATVCRLYDHFGYTMEPDDVARLERWIEAHPKPQNRYTLRTYGLDQAVIDERFADYVDYFEIRN